MSLTIPISGMNVCLWLSSHTTIVIKRALRWLRLKHSMVVDVEQNWSEPGERWFFGVDLVKETEEKVRQIQNNLKIAQSRQKSYADK